LDFSCYSTFLFCGLYSPQGCPFFLSLTFMPPSPPFLVSPPDFSCLRAQIPPLSVGVHYTLLVAGFSCCFLFFPPDILLNPRLKVFLPSLVVWGGFYPHGTNSLSFRSAPFLFFAAEIDCLFCILVRRFLRLPPFPLLLRSRTPFFLYTLDNSLPMKILTHVFVFPRPFPQTSAATQHPKPGLVMWHGKDPGRPVSPLFGMCAPKGRVSPPPIPVLAPPPSRVVLFDKFPPPVFPPPTRFVAFLITFF